MGLNLDVVYELGRVTARAHAHRGSCRSFRDRQDDPTATPTRRYAEVRRGPARLRTSPRLCEPAARQSQRRRFRRRHGLRRRLSGACGGWPTPHFYDYPGMSVGNRVEVDPLAIFIGPDRVVLKGFVPTLFFWILLVNALARLRSSWRERNRPP